MFLRGKTDRTPFGLQRLYLLGQLLPTFRRHRFAVNDRLEEGFELVNDRLLTLQVLLLLAVQFLKERLMLLIDHGRSRFETLPQLLT